MLDFLSIISPPFSTFPLFWRTSFTADVQLTTLYPPWKGELRQRGTNVIYNPVLHHAKLHLPALHCALYRGLRKPL